MSDILKKMGITRKNLGQISQKILPILIKILSIIPSPRRHPKAYIITAISLVGFVVLATGLIFLEMQNGHSRGITSVCFSPDGKLVASVDWDCTIRFWNIDTKVSKRIELNRGRKIKSITFSPDGEKLFSITDRSIDTWHTKNKCHLQTLDTGEYCNTCFDVSSDNRLLATSYKYHAIKVLDAHSGECFKILGGHYGHVTSVKFSPDNKIIASADDQETVKLWSIDTGACLKIIDNFSRGIQCICFSPDSKHIVCAEKYGQTTIWGVQTGKLLKKLNGIGSSSAIAFSPDGQTIASACGFRAIKIIDAKTGEVVQSLEGHSDDITAIAFSPDGRFLASGSDDTTVRIWNVKTGHCLKKFGSYFGALYDRHFR